MALVINGNYFRYRIGGDPMSVFFKKCYVRIPRDTPMAVIIAILGEAGVLIEGRYKLEYTWDGTRIEYLGTNLQEMIIETSIKNIGKDGFFNT